MARKPIKLPFRVGATVYYLYRSDVEVVATVAIIENRRIILSFIHPISHIMVRRVVVHRHDRARIHLEPVLFTQKRT